MTCILFHKFRYYNFWDYSGDWLTSTGGVVAKARVCLKCGFMQTHDYTHDWVTDNRLTIQDLEDHMNKLRNTTTTERHAATVTRQGRVEALKALGRD